MDKKCAPCCGFFSEYRDYVDTTIEMFRDLVFYMGAQRFRTPRGLDLIKKHYRLGIHWAKLDDDVLE